MSLTACRSTSFRGDGVKVIKKKHAGTVSTGLSEYPPDFFFAFAQVPPVQLRPFTMLKIDAEGAHPVTQTLATPVAARAASTAVVLPQPEGPKRRTPDDAGRFYASEEMEKKGGGG